MRVKAFVFDGYPAGQSDFASRYAALDDEARAGFDAMVHNVARAMFSDALSQPYVALTVIGHSDRQDLPGLTHQQAQADEAEAAENRAVDAWSWLRARITEEVGAPDDSWTEDSPKVTWAMVFAGSGQLQVHDPVTEEDRLRNRRVVILFSHFEIDV